MRASLMATAAAQRLSSAAAIASSTYIPRGLTCSASTNKQLPSRLVDAAAYGIPVLVVAGGWLVRYELARRGVGSTRPLPATAEPAATPGLAVAAVTALVAANASQVDASQADASQADASQADASQVDTSQVAALDLGGGIVSEPMPRRVRVFAGDQTHEARV